MEVEKLEELGARAELVAAAHAERSAAIAGETAAEAALLEAVIARVKPALRALGTRQVIVDPDDGTQEWSQDRLICLTDKCVQPGRLESRHDDTRGVYGASDIVLREDGVLLRVDYSGHWSQWQGERSAWRAELTPITAMAVCAEWKVESLIEHLRQLLDQQALGKGEARAKAARERAEKLTALATLLGGQS